MKRTLTIVWRISITLGLAWCIASNRCLRTDLQYTIDSLVLTQNTVISQGQYEQSEQKETRDNSVRIFQLQNVCRGLREDVAKLKEINRIPGATP